MARKRKEIDLEQVEEMAAELCTQEEIGRDMGFERTMFHRRADVRKAFEQGKNQGRMSLRHMLWRAAKSGNIPVLIFLAKNELGYSDDPESLKLAREKMEMEKAQNDALMQTIPKIVRETDGGVRVDES
ncbi:MAG TPA: hypothetical protein IAB50_03500 [Candidatus Faecivicinus avistercoris]|nr:hypothetical protein [Candidatus Faecivicinus avistercoris]